MSLRTKEWLSPLLFGLFVGLTTIQCRHEGAVQMAIAISAGVALALSFSLWASVTRERHKE